MSNLWTLLRRLLCLSHDYGITAERGSIFMRCRKCGTRTTGWHVDPEDGGASGRPTPHGSREPAPAESALGLRMSGRAIRDA